MIFYLILWLLCDDFVHKVLVIMKFARGAQPLCIQISFVDDFENIPLPMVEIVSTINLVCEDLGERIKMDVCRSATGRELWYDCR